MTVITPKLVMLFIVITLIGCTCLACRSRQLPTATDVTPLPLTPFPESTSTLGCASDIDDKERELWHVTVAPYLEDDLWLDLYLYDAGHYLMVPLHAAFLLNEPSWQTQFSEHLKRFLEYENRELEPTSNNRLARLHYFYLISRFVVLAEQSGQESSLTLSLVNLLYKRIEKIWHDPAWMWGRDPFRNGMAERIEWKLNTFDVPYSYYRAITDEELFAFAIAADLRAYQRLTGYKNDSSPLLSEILSFAQLVFESEVRVRDSGWLFQPSVWRDHPDYAFTGHDAKLPDMEPRPVEGIAWDSSHSHRFPLWLTSLMGAYDINATQRGFYHNLRDELERQFISHVLVIPSSEFDGYRTTNFMDGRNGVYRWKHDTQGEDGYGPYELSGTMLLGWWSFLSTNRICTVYQDIASRFPLSDELIEVYVGPNSSRERHALVKEPEVLKNGLTELIVRLASKKSRTQ